MLSAIPPSECTRVRESVSAGLDGELSELEAAGLDHHLRDCEECTAFARQLHALHAELAAAPLERPQIQVFVSARRRPLVRLQTAVAAAIVAVAAGSSFAVGRVVGVHGGPTASKANARAWADFLSVQAGTDERQIRAMLRDLQPSDSLRAGRVIAV